MKKDYTKFLIKSYKYWEVNIHENQSYLGRLVVWCKREDALDLTEATKEEQKELFIILNDLRKAINKTFKPDWLNHAFLGNEMRHLHCHFIPRYAKPVEFMGVKFEDKHWGHNYRTDHDFKTPKKVLSAIQDKIKKAI